MTTLETNELRSPKLWSIWNHHILDMKYKFNAGSEVTALGPPSCTHRPAQTTWSVAGLEEAEA